MWVRGLKLYFYIKYGLTNKVAPYVGAWIETCTIRKPQGKGGVAPYVGAWIETNIEVGSVSRLSRTLCGCVD